MLQVQVLVHQLLGDIVGALGLAAALTMLAFAWVLWRVTR